MNGFGATKIRKVERRDKSKRSFRFDYAETEVSKAQPKYESRAQRQMKTEFSIWLCRDGASKAQPKYEKSGAAANENSVFDLAVPGWSIQDAANVRKVERRNGLIGYANIEIQGMELLLKCMKRVPCSRFDRTRSERDAEEYIQSSDRDKNKI